MTLLSEVAAHSGVSLSTASRALSRDTAHLVSPRTRERVLASSALLGFRPNPLAQGLRGRYSMTIGVMVHDIRDPYFAEAARAVADAAGAEGFLTVVCNSERRPDVELRYLAQMIGFKAAGVLFVGGGLDDAGYRQKLATLVRSIEGYGGAVVALGPRLDRWPAEVPDNRGGAVLATDHLIELGHRRIAFIDGPPGLRTSVERREGYLSALQQAGIEPDMRLVAEGDYSAPGGMRAMARLLQANGGFTAVFASNDAMATGCLQELRRQGLRVPLDVSLVGFDDLPLAQWLDPPLTSVGVPMAEIGTAGVLRLLGRLRNPDRLSRPRIKVHACSLVIRNSTGPAPVRCVETPRRKAAL